MSQALEWIVFPTLYGWVGVARSVAGMWGLTLPVENAEVARESIIKLLKGFRGEIREVALPEQPWESIITSIQSYFRGEEISFQFPLDLFGYTLFQRKVLLATAKIPYGQTITYGELAEKAGCPKGARAVGQVLARNRLPIVVPCHRVVARRGGGGFAGGMEWKRRLLELEKSEFSGVVPWEN